MKRAGKIFLKILKWLGIFLLGIIILLFLIILLLRTEWGQQKVVNYAVNYVEDKTGTEVNIDRLFITFDGNVQLEGLYLEDQKADTLIYSESLEAGVSISSLISGNIDISEINWHGVKANIVQYKDSTFNFSFLMDALAPAPADSTAASDTATSAPPKINLGPINLSQLDIYYLDSVFGFEADVLLGTLELDPDNFDFETFHYAADELSINELHTRVLQFSLPPPSSDTSSAPLPFISFEKVEITSSNLEYITKPDTLHATAKIESLYAEDGTFALDSQHIDLHSLDLFNSDIYLKIPAVSGNATTPSSDSATTGFVWPDYTVNVNAVLFRNNNITIDQGEGSGLQGVFDPQHLAFSNLDMGLQNIEFKDRYASIEIDSLNFMERSGFILRRANLTAELTNSGLQVSNADINTNRSHLHANANISYSSFNAWMEDPTQFNNISLNIDNSSLNLRDAYFFNDSLRYDSLFIRTDGYPIRINANIEGDVKNISLHQLDVKWLNNTHLWAEGRILGLPDTNEVYVDLPVLNLNSGRKDLALLTNSTEVDELPESLQIRSSLKGDAEKLYADVKANTPTGNLTFNGTLGDLLETPEYKGELVADNFEIGPFIGQPDLEAVSMNVEFNGKGITLETLELESEIAFQKLVYNDYNYKDLKLTANVEDHEAVIKASHRDSNLVFHFNADAQLDTNLIDATFNINLEGADLYDLNFSSRRIKFATEMKGYFRGVASDFTSAVYFSRALIVRRENSYRVDTIFAELSNSADSTVLDIQSPILSGHLEANTSIQTTVSSLESYIKRAIRKDTIKVDTTYKNIAVVADFNVNSSPLLENVLTPKLERMDSISISFDFKPGEELLRLDIHSPIIIYGPNELVNLHLNINAGEDSLIGALAFDHFSSDFIDMHPTHINTEITNGQGFAQIQTLNEHDEEVFYMALDVVTNDRFTELRVDSEHFILNGNPWEIPKENVLRMEDDHYYFEYMSLRRNDQLMDFRSFNDGHNVELVFENFRLSSISSILNHDETPVKGFLNGRFEIRELNATPAFTANIELKELQLLNNPIGNLSLTANNLQDDIYTMDLVLKGEQIDLTMDGYYSTAGESQELNFDLDLNKLEMKLVESFLEEQVNNSKGHIEGAIKIGGSLANIDYDGNLIFKNAALTPVMLGTQFLLNDDRIAVKKNVLQFDNFTLEDANGNISSLSGKVNTENILNPTFDLRVNSNKFRFLNSEEEDNDLFYGKAIVSLDLKIEGDLDLPVIDGKARLIKGSNITYVVPLSQAQMRDRKGIVKFQNMKDSTDVFSEEMEITAELTGLDISTRLTLEPETRFNIIIDPQTGDVLSLQGEANLQLDINPNGEMDLVGYYEINDGYYKLSLYDLVSKNFNIMDGSSVDWSGNPNDAALDITAIYKIKTAPTDLMADRLSGADASTLNQYKQEVPFEVMLYIRGTIAEPEISFGLEMPEESRSTFGGSVYNRVQQLNERESELNKQVFSLIVFNRFLPTNIASDDGGATSQLARSSVSKLLSNQLNKLSEQYISGVEINFDVNSYTDYQTGAPNQRTDLNISLRKSFADGRVIVEVGSQVGIEGQQQQQNSGILGDVQAEYLITENGTYRLQVFRKNQFQDIVEGQIIITGLALLFNKEFNNWNELLKKQPPPEEPLPDLEDIQNNEGVNNDEDNPETESP